jgi:hypothetical protein
VSAYPNQPRSGSEWPAQPPRYTPQGPGGQPRPAPARQLPPRRRRRGRGWIALLVVLVVLAVIFVVGDQVARSYAQNMIASKIKSDGFPVKPAVSIKGFPFLTQVVAHDVRTVDLSASNVREGGLDIASINATASGVHLNSSFNGATIDTIDGTALVTFSSLASATGAHGVTITADPSAGPNMAKVSVGPLAAVARVSQAGPAKIAVQMQSLDGIPASAIGALPGYNISLPKLPVGLQVTGVSVTAQGVRIAVAAHNTTLSQ